MGDGAGGVLLAPSPGLGDSSFQASLFPDEDRLSKRKSIEVAPILALDLTKGVLKEVNYVLASHHCHRKD